MVGRGCDADKPIASIPHSEETLNPPRQSLSLYVTSLMMDFAQADYEMPASMMAAIRYQDIRVGERGVRADWVWQFWQHDWVFRQESEVWGAYQLFLIFTSYSIAYLFRQSVLSHLCLSSCRTQGFRKRTHSSYAFKFTRPLDLLYLSNPRLRTCQGTY